MTQRWEWSNGLVTEVEGNPFDESDVTVSGDWTFTGDITATGDVDLEDADVTLPASFSEEDWEVVASGTATNVGTIEFLGLDDTYHSYHLVYDEGKAATDVVTFKLQFSVDNGANWIAGTSYWWAHTWFGADDAASATNSNSPADAAIQLQVGSFGNGTNETWAGEVSLVNMNNSTEHAAAAHFKGHMVHTSLYISYGGGRCGTAHLGVNAARVFLSSGNITNLRYTLYGRRA